MDGVEPLGVLTLSTIEAEGVGGDGDGGIGIMTGEG